MKIINYADLSYPEVRELPRPWPVLVPLGLDHYDLETATRALSTEVIILLPAVPYGFQCDQRTPRSRLQVPPGLLERTLAGISKWLNIQGFQQVYFLNGHGEQKIKVTDYKLIDQPYLEPVELTWPENLGERVVLISTGHTEQHGYHLPLSTDSLIVEAIAARLQELAPDEVFCLPVWPFGVSTHTREFPATLNLGGRVFEDFFLVIVDRLIGLGADKIYFSNGHGGNHSFLVNVIKYAGENHPKAFIATEWLHTTGPELNKYRESAIGGMGHGGELETSYILHLRPDLVKMDRATREIEFAATQNYYMDWVEGGSLIANPPWSDDTTSGIYGDATLATAEKGRLWLEAAAQQKLSTIREIGLQQQLRQAKRALKS